MRRARGERVREGWCDIGSGLDSDDRERELHSWGGSARRLGLWHGGRIEENQSVELEVLRVVFGWWLVGMWADLSCCVILGTTTIEGMIDAHDTEDLGFGDWRSSHHNGIHIPTWTCQKLQTSFLNCLCLVHFCFLIILDCYFLLKMNLSKGFCQLGWSQLAWMLFFMLFECLSCSIFIYASWKVLCIIFGNNWSPSSNGSRASYASIMFMDCWDKFGFILLCAMLLWLVFFVYLS